VVFHVDDQLEFGCQVHGQFGWLGAFQNAIDIVRRTLE
jgi:hypothetical protein